MSNTKESTTTNLKLESLHYAQPKRVAPITAFATPFSVSFLTFCVLSAVLIGWKPLQLSIATVFLFAGPHNWMEFRYFLARMPARWGKSKPFFSFGIGGVLVLAAAYVVLYWLGQSWYLDGAAWTLGISIWNTALLMWVCVLVWMGGRRSVKRDWSWIFPVGFALAAVAWAAPLWFSLALVYIHPLIALWFLDRLLKRTRPQWRTGYHAVLLFLPLILVIMWLRLASSANLPDADALTWRISQHSGASILSGVSSHLLVSTHVFLETIHYGAWLVIIPLVGLRSRIFDTNRIPLAIHREGWPRTVKLGLVAAGLVVVVLWIGFSADYTVTRDVYFTFAMAHVLAEVPFLIRLL